MRTLKFDGAFAYYWSRRADPLYRRFVRELVRRERINRDRLGAR